MVGDVVGIIKVCEQISFTKYMFGKQSEIAGQILQVWEKNIQGDCLCLDPKCTNLVDVDNRDIVKFYPVPQENFLGQLKEILNCHR